MPGSTRRRRSQRTATATRSPQTCRSAAAPGTMLSAPTVSVLSQPCARRVRGAAPGAGEGRGGGDSSGFRSIAPDAQRLSTGDGSSAGPGPAAAYDGRPTARRRSDDLAARTSRCCDGGPRSSLPAVVRHIERLDPPSVSIGACPERGRSDAGRGVKPDRRAEGGLGYLSGRSARLAEPCRNCAGVGRDQAQLVRCRSGAPGGQPSDDRDRWLCRSARHDLPAQSIFRRE